MPAEKRYTYKVVELEAKAEGIQTQLNAHGQDGWRCVGIFMPKDGKLTGTMLAVLEKEEGK